MVSTASKRANFLNFVPKNFHDELENAIDQGRTGERVLLELEVRRPDGRHVLAEIHGSFIAFGKESLTCLVARGVTPRRRDHEMQVQQERLRALGEMASVIAHDFNNSLTPILACSNLLLSFPDTLEDRPTTLRSLNLIQTAATEAASVIERVREFYRPRSEVDAFGVVDLAEIIDRAVSLTRPNWNDEALGENPTIVIERHYEDLPTVSGDKYGLMTALTNLILNSADAMPDGGTIALMTGVRPGHVILEVADTGVGMGKDLRKRAFEPYV